MPILSKSKYLSGLQCPLLLWVQVNAKDELPPIEASQQALFDQGHAVGDYAKQLYPGGEEVPYKLGFSGTLQRTQELLQERKPIFEASFLYGDLYCRADILVPAGEEEWDLIEVKSGTQVKEENINDVAFQLYVLEHSGLRIRTCSLMHINNEYTRQGEIEPEKLLVSEEITEAVQERYLEVPENIEAQRHIITSPEPSVRIGRHCTSPYECPLKGKCFAFLPAFDITELYRSNGFDFYEQGYEAITDIPTEKLTGKQQIQQTAITTNNTQITAKPINDWLNHLEYPLYLLDFETANSAVPLWDGTRPYQQVPFQFSLHIIKEPGAEPEHHEHLAETPDDPRPGLIQALKSIGPKGTILAYNQSFEKRVLNDLADAHPEEATFLLALVDRFDDLIIPFRNFWYYHPEQHGSCSIKAVLPALTNISYEGMTINKGDQAAREWQRVISGTLPTEERQKIFKALREYCKQDTQAMIDLLEALQEVL